jgi:hypothetical protein
MAGLIPASVSTALRLYLQAVINRSSPFLNPDIYFFGGFCPLLDKYKNYSIDFNILGTVF